MPHDQIHQLHDPMNGRTPSGDGEARGTGYGAGGLGSGADRADGHAPPDKDALGTDGSGHRKSASTDGDRIPSAEEIDTRRD